MHRTNIKMVTGLTFENPIFANFAFYATICVGKMLLMSFLTARVRLTKRVSESLRSLRYQLCILILTLLQKTYEVKSRIASKYLIRNTTRMF